MAAHPLTDFCAAISVGVVGALPSLDLDYVRGLHRRGRHERRDAPAPASTSRCRAPPRARRSAARELDAHARPRRARDRPDLRAPARDDRGSARRRAGSDAPARRRDGEPRQGPRDPGGARSTRAPTSSCSRGRTTCPRSRRPAATLVDNARLKAEALRDATGIAAVGEDTGLEVDALGGAPGVFSARYAGEDATLRRQRRQAPPRGRRGAPSVAHRAVPHRGRARAARTAPSSWPRASSKG